MKKVKKLFILDLDQNAMDSLKHAVEHFLGKKPNDLKYTILHVFHAIELFLKARLAQAHPILIYDRPEDASDDAKTVAFDSLVRRIKNIGVDLSKDQLEDLGYLRKVRNSIEHHKFRGDHKNVVEYVGKAMKFLDKFLEDELDIKLREQLDEKIYKTLIEAVYSYEELVQKAVRAMEDDLPLSKERLDHTIHICENCGEETLPFPDPSSKSRDTIHCYFCGEEWYVEECSKCGGPILSSEPFKEENWRGCCDSCFSYMVSKDD